MNLKTTKAKVFTRIVSGAAALMIGVAGVNIAPTFAQAATPPPTTQPADATGDKAAKFDAKLEKVYAREQQALTKQQDHLTKANVKITEAQAKIDTLKGEGKDVTALQNALNTFKSQLANARTQHDAAGKILAAHAGFDANGKVTDEAAARQTVKDAAQSLRGAHTTLKQAVRDAREALREFKKSAKATA